MLFKNTHNIEPNFEELIGNCLRFYLFIFRARGREGGREGEKHRSVDSHKAPSRDLALNPGTCPDWESNKQPSGSQAGAQSPEPHQPGLQPGLSGFLHSRGRLEPKKRMEFTVRGQG